MRLAVGLTLMALGMLLVLQTLGGEGDYGGVVIIGPIPIVFGSSPQTAVMGLLMGLTLMLLLARRTKWR